MSCADAKIAGRCRAGLRCSCLLIALVSLCEAGVAGANPSAHGGYGQPLPDTSLPKGTVTVKVIGTSMSDAKPGLQVELMALERGKAPRRLAVQVTGADGRARFNSVNAAAQLFAQVLGKGARSTLFELPATGGLRLLLSVAASETMAGQRGGAKSPAGRVTAPAPKQTITSTDGLRIGASSYLLAQLEEDRLDCLQVLMIINPRADAIVAPPQGLVIPLPVGARNPSVGAEAKAWFHISSDKRSARLTKPLLPGQTMVRISFHLPVSGAALSYRQKLPLPQDGSLFALQNSPTIAVSGPSFQAREIRGTAAEPLPVFRFSKVEAGRFWEFSVTGLPYRDETPRNVTLGLALAILLWGLFARGAARNKSQAGAVSRAALIDELVALEREGADEAARKRAIARYRSKAERG